MTEATSISEARTASTVRGLISRENSIQVLAVSPMLGLPFKYIVHVIFEAVVPSAKQHVEQH